MARVIMYYEGILQHMVLPSISDSVPVGSNTPPREVNGAGTVSPEIESHDVGRKIPNQKGKPEGLTFIINPETEHASVDLLLHSVQDIVRLLRRIDDAIHGPRHQHKWIVRELRSSAPTITVEETPLNGVRSAEVIGQGLRTLTSGTDEPPQHFTVPVLENLAKMNRLFTGTGARAKSIDVLVSGDLVATIEEDISEKVKRVVSSGYRGKGSVEGTLEAIDIHGAPVVTIWERVFRTPVRCHIPKENEWTELVVGFLGKRVTVTGEVQYFSNGKPRTIRDVVRIKDATPNPNLPRAEYGSIPDEEAVHDPVEFLNSIRGYE